MKNSILISFIFAFNLFTSCRTNESPVEETIPVLDTYTESIILHREQADSEMIESEHSPISTDSIDSFVGLNYYLIDPTWNIHSPYLKIDTSSVFNMPTSTERVIPMIKDGLIQFIKNGDTIRLFAYRYVDHPDEGLFVPFLDKTNGDETYGGGRYIEVEYAVNDSVWIDFNKAYNPYCAYNHHYSCPIPPLENTVKVEVNAGELVLYKL